MARLDFLEGRVGCLCGRSEAQLSGFQRLQTPADSRGMRVRVKGGVCEVPSPLGLALW